MSTLSIVLDEEGPFRPGQKVKGAIEVQLDAPARCEGLALIREWRAHGKGEPFSGSSGTWELFVGDWEAGEQRIPFSVKLPKRGPLTYHGELLQVDWYLSAEAELKGSNLSAERTIEVQLPEGTRDLELVNDRRPENYGGDPTDFSCLATPILTVALVLGYLAQMWLREEKTVWGASCGVAALALVGYLALRWLNRGRAERRLGLLVDVSERARPGEQVTVELTLLPSRAVSLQGIHATLKGQEIVAWKEGESFEHAMHVVHEEDRALSEAVELQRGEPLELYGSFSLPDDAPYSFHATGKELIWQVVVSIAIAGEPDWGRSEVVVVGP